MKCISVQEFSRNPKNRPRVLAMGVFDGVHVGHQALIARARDLAGREGECLVMTFDPHPQVVLGRNEGSRLMLTSLAERARLVEPLSADCMIVVPFDGETASMSPDDFMSRVVAAHVRPDHVVVGFNFTFGACGAGTPVTLKTLASRLGFAVTVVRPVMRRGRVVSSSAIRDAVQAGDLTTARCMLGRPHRIHGEVVRGASMGHDLGYPTANLALDPGLLVPKPGVYAVRAAFPERGLAGAAAVASAGGRPTFESRDVEDVPPVLEVHVPGFAGDLYGARGWVELLAWLRDLRRFAAPSALARQIETDLATALDLAAQIECEDLVCYNAVEHDYTGK